MHISCKYLLGFLGEFALLRVVDCSVCSETPCAIEASQVDASSYLPCEIQEGKMGFDGLG